MQETWGQPLDWEDPLEKEMVTHSSILPGQSHGQRRLVGYSPQSCLMLVDLEAPEVRVRGQGELSSYLLWTLWVRPLGQLPGGEQVGRVM